MRPLPPATGTRSFSPPPPTWPRGALARRSAGSGASPTGPTRGRISRSSTHGPSRARATCRPRRGPSAGEAPTSACSKSGPRAGKRRSPTPCWRGCGGAAKRPGSSRCRDLEGLRSKSQAAPPALLDAFEAVTAGDEHLYDRARAALERARPTLGGTPLLADAEDAAAARVGTERVAAECDPGRTTARDTLGCLDALRSTGDREGEKRELARLRALLGGPRRFLALELRDAAAAGDFATAGRAFAAMSPAERTMTALAMLPAGPSSPAGGDTLARLLQMAPTARDAPGAIAPLLRAAGDDPTGDLDGDRRAPRHRRPRQPPPAELGDGGARAHRALRDHAGGPAALGALRRAAGQRNDRRRGERPGAGPRDLGPRRDARAAPPHPQEGRARPRAGPHAACFAGARGPVAARAGRRRGGRLRGLVLPGDTGDVGIDTPDLLPERTSVHDATIELRMPRSLRSALWCHALLGKSAERIDGDTRVVVWHLVDHLARRVEDGVPKMDRSVGVSFSTTRVGRRRARAARDGRDARRARPGDRGVGARRGGARRGQAAADASARSSTRSSSPPARRCGSPIPGRSATTAAGSPPCRRRPRARSSRRTTGAARGSSFAACASSAFPAISSSPRTIRSAPTRRSRRTSGGSRIRWSWRTCREADARGRRLDRRGRRGAAAARRSRVAGAPGAPRPPRPTGPSRRSPRSAPSRTSATRSTCASRSTTRGDARGTFAVVLRGRDAQELSEALFRIVGAERQRALRDVVLGVVAVGQRRRAWSSRRPRGAGRSASAPT